MRKVPIALVFAAIALTAVTVMLNVAMSSIVTYQGTPISLGGGWIAVNATTQGHAYVNGTMRYVVIPVVSIYGKTLTNITAGNVLLFSTSAAKCAAVAYNQYYIGFQLYNNSGLWTPVEGRGSCPAQIGANNVTYITGSAIIHITFINLDDDMYHNFVITTAPPPYPYNVMPYIGMYGGMGPQMMLYMRWLPPANYNSGYAYGYQYTVSLNLPGTYWYICTYPGHAEEGMYGKLIVVGG